MQVSEHRPIDNNTSCKYLTLEKPLRKKTLMPINSSWETVVLDPVEYEMEYERKVQPIEMIINRTIINSRFKSSSGWASKPQIITEQAIGVIIEQGKLNKGKLNQQLPSLSSNRICTLLFGYTSLWLISRLSFHYIVVIYFFNLYRSGIYR